MTPPSRLPTRLSPALAPALVRACVGALVLLLAAVAAAPVQAEPPPKTDSSTAALDSPHQGDPIAVKEEGDIAAVEDPMALIAAGRHWLKGGNTELAAKSFEAALKRDEINNYTKFAGTPYGEAVHAELMEDFETSRKTWRLLFDKDVLGAYQMIQIKSLDPKRDELLAEAKTRVEGLVAKAKAGETPH
ncbi:MAG: hypothetical protein AAFS10_16175, partial [Myxococcota bacterium]